ncbi:MAG: hypothetical protein AOA66_0672 [Candidatus Bathyarchaeota archaeon BA2]|nr:MAG: hypothetical protein AOA66_0672 [Candidatus Bathyarchaeota archaeon BA2]
MVEKGKAFDKLFIEAVDEGLTVLGESGRQMIFFHLENSYSIKKHKIPKKPEAFATGLEKIFGAGASVIEKLILKSLYSKLGLKYEDREERPFAEYVNEVKEADDAKEAKQDNRRRSSSSNRQSLEVRSSQQSSIPCMEMEKEDFSYFYR